jgi:protein gp37
MSDLFHDEVPLEYIDRVFDVMRRAPQHVFQVLTKRPDRLVLWHRGRSSVAAVPAHVWLGVSVESMRYAWRIERLRQVEAEVRFISAEPLLGPLTGLDLRGISWLIAGGESAGSPRRALVEVIAGRAQPKPQAESWLLELLEICRAADVAFFFKQWGGRTPKAGGRELAGRTWSEYPVANS